MNAILIGAAAAYVLAVIAMWVLQERFLFYPQPVRSTPPLPPGWHAEAVRLRASGGVDLVGLLALPPAPDGSAVMYFGGNAEEVTSAAADADRLYGRSAVLLVNYRGYGASTGVPSEAALVADALALYDWLAARDDIDAQRIGVHGRSLGTGVAVQLAAARPVRCVILTSPFDSAVAVARQAYPWLPVAWLMRHPFESMRHARSIQAPALIVIGAEDTLIRPERSEALAAQWRGPVETLRFARRGHGDVHLDPAYEPAVHAFAARCLRGA